MKKKKDNTMRRKNRNDEGKQIQWAGMLELFILKHRLTNMFLSKTVFNWGKENQGYKNIQFRQNNEE